MFFSINKCNIFINFTFISFLLFDCFLQRKKSNIKPKTYPQYGKPSVLICKDHKKQCLHNFHNQYDNLLLPLARLLLRTFLPSAVLILFLKPCSFFLCLFFGWYVLSTCGTSVLFMLLYFHIKVI